MQAVRSRSKGSSYFLWLSTAFIAGVAPRASIASAQAAPEAAAITNQLVKQVGSGAPTSEGDYVSAGIAHGGLNSPYRYFIEVPPGLAGLVVDLFDADVGAGGGGENNADRDRNNGSYNTCARYQLIRPNGSEARSIVFGPSSGCALSSSGLCQSCDNAWANLWTEPNPAGGHWEVRVDMSSAVTTGDDVNAYGIRAHDGVPGSGGTELNVYAESFYIVGVNQGGQSRTYSLYPYITSGCVADANDFDFDATGSLSLTRRGGGYTYADATMSGNDVWQSVPFTGWTNDQSSIGYGIWTGMIAIEGQGSSNQGSFYFGNFDAASPPPTSQPQAGTFRVYLPTDAGGAPLRPYAEQFLAFDDGPNPPQVGRTTRMTVTVRLVNPGPRAIAFSTPANVVTASVPGEGALYAGSPRMSQGTLVSEPSVGGRGNVVWNPGSIAGGVTAFLSYQVNVTPSTDGQRIPVTGTPASNGTTARFLDETGNSAQARATYTFGPLCEVAAQQGVLTHALVSSFRAVIEGAVVRVIWETATEVGTVAFAPYRYDPAAREWIPIADEPTLSSQQSPQGARYDIEDPGAPGFGPLVYALVERTFDGAERAHGPFVVDLQPADSSTETLPRASRTRLLDRRKAASSNATSLPVRPASSAVQILVRERGLYYVDAFRIAELTGVPESFVRTLLRGKALSLTNRGNRVAWHPAPDEAGLYFYGERLESPYTDGNVYRLSPGEGLPMPSLPSGEPGTGEEWATFSERVEREEERFAGTMASRDPDSDFWFWDVLFAGNVSQSSRRFGVALGGVASTNGTAAIEVDLLGATESDVQEEHHVLVSVNGVPVGESRFDGLERHRFTLDFPQHLLVEGANEVELTALLDAGVSQSIVYVDSFALRYSRHYRTDSASFHFGSDENRVVSVDGFLEPMVSLLDLSDPSRPAWISGAKVEPSEHGYRVSFAPPTANAPYLAVTPSGVKAPVAVRADAPSELRSKGGGADYLVIAPEGLALGARELASYRGASGLRTAVVLMEDVFDEFHHGIPSPHALRDFLAYAYGNWRTRPRYVVLIGKGTYDYKNVLGQGDNPLPPLMAATENGLFASDVRMADVLADDGVPELAIGRIPALSDEEVFAYVARLREQETAPPDSWTRRVLIAADRPQGGANFASDAESLAGLLPPGFEASRVYLSDGFPVGEARQRMFEEVESGVGFLTYVGHGALDRLSAESLLTVADVGTLRNQGKRPLVTTWTCNAGRFDVPGFVSLGEELVISPAGGASAVWAPTGLSDNVQARWLAEEFFTVSFQGTDERLGDALQRTLERFQARGASKSMLRNYQLLGDPALLLRRPEPSAPDGS
jgi:hypothetical protein